MSVDRSVEAFSGIMPFCGHATIAVGAVLGSAGNETTYQLETAVGSVPVTVRSSNGHTEVSLTSVDTKHKPAPDTILEEILSALRWRKEELDSTIPPAIAYAGVLKLDVPETGGIIVTGSVVEI